MSDVVRLPVQHPRAPHCPSCGRDVPTLKDALISFSKTDLREWEILSITFRVRCPCGDVWQVEKRAK